VENGVAEGNRDVDVTAGVEVVVAFLMVNGVRVASTKPVGAVGSREELISVPQAKVNTRMRSVVRISFNEVIDLDNRRTFHTR